MYVSGSEKSDLVEAEKRPGSVAPLIACAGWNQVSGRLPFSEMVGSQLERYASVLPAVEINSSFYRPHRQTTYERWAASVPPAFRFSVKLPRTITHTIRLAHTDAELAKFEDETAGLAEKLGCVLVQLPPSLQFDMGIAQSFFEEVRRTFSCMIACEARHPTWFGANATAMLTAHAVTRVIADPAKGQIEPHQSTTSTTYMRLHGSPAIYRSSYSDAYLAQVADDLAAQAHSGQPAWVIFDNAASGAALPNALAVLDAFRARSEEAFKLT